MRLIDGDALMEHVYRDRLDSRELIAEMVRNTPTIEPERKTGRWIDKNGNIVAPFWERYECSVCGARSDNYFYCPNCGAYMGR